MTYSDSAPASTQAGRKGWSAWSLVGWIFCSLLAALAVVVACLPSVLGTPERITKLVAAAVPELAADVKPRAVRIGWFGPLVLEDLAIVPRNGERPPLHVGRVEVQNGLAGILLSAGDLGRIRIEDLEADVVFDREHRSNIDSILPPDDAVPAGRAAGPRRAAVALRLDVDDAIVRISGPWSSETWVSDPIDIQAALGNAADGYAAWTVEPVQLLSEAKLTQTVAHEVLAYIVPVFADAARTSGRFSLKLDGATFPVGRPEDARLAGMLSMHEVVLGPGPLVEKMFRELPFNLPPPPTIRIADEADVAFHLAERRMWHEGLEFGIPLKKAGQRLDVRSQGSVGLDDRSLDLKLSLPIPADLPQDRPLVAAVAGKQISLGVGGVLGEPQVIFDGSIKEAAGQVLVDLIDRLRNGPRPVAPDAQPAPAEAPGRQPPRPGWSPASGSDAAVKPASAAEPVAPSAAATPDSGKPNDPAATESPGRKAARLAGETAQQAGAKPETTDAVVDIIGGVLDEVARRRAERRAAEAANPEQAVPPSPPSPLRQRIRQRLQRPISPPSSPAPPQ
ncbi:MAG: hypothetical protein FJ286_01040 [Planctomycetes bacterium]|nr:hypothetical protein [Planctomycetota bacterium]